ncbi:MAG: lipocalin family protein [Syntrophales bacterium]
MKKRILVLSVMLVLMATLAIAADYSKDIIGNWTYEFKGQQAAVEHKADGAFTLVMGTTTVKGTYTVKGNSLTLITDGKKTPYTIQSYDGKKMTMKRDKDSRVIVYVKK